MNKYFSNLKRRNFCIVTIGLTENNQKCDQNYGKFNQFFTWYFD